MFVILSHYFSPSLANFQKSLLLEDASYFFGEYTVGPPGVRSGSCLCAAASSCLSGRKREKGGKRGGEERKTCTMFDQRGAESTRMEAGIRVSQPNGGRRDSMRLLRSKASAGVFCFQSVFKGARADPELKHC